MKTETNMDKSVWPTGPWTTEPDRVEWRLDKYPNLVLLIVRVPSHGALCGYVGVPPSHPWHGADYDTLDVDVHGGLTYGNKCRGRICHEPEPGETEDVFWLGFDCAHAGDLCPGIGNVYEDVYCDIAYVTAEVEKLAEQASRAQ